MVLYDVQSLSLWRDSIHTTTISHIEVYPNIAGRLPEPEAEPNIRRPPPPSTKPPPKLVSPSQGPLLRQPVFRKFSESTVQPKSLDIVSAPDIIQTLIGNYCAPYYSNHKLQTSVVGDLPPLFPEDQCCYTHDADYFLGVDPDIADEDFITCLKPINTFRSKLFSSLVDMSSRGRSLSRTPKLKGGSNASRARSRTPARRAPVQAGPASVATVRSVAASYGTTIQNVPSKMRKTRAGLTVSGSDIILTLVDQPATAVWDNAGQILLHPTTWFASQAAQYVRNHAKFRFRRLALEFIPLAPTSTTGNIMITISKNIQNPALNGTAPSFVTQALASGKGIMIPIWQGGGYEVPISAGLRLCDPLECLDLEQAYPFELVVYANTSLVSVATIGYIVAHWDIEFVDPTFQPHTSLCPFPANATGNFFYADSSATPQQNAIVQLTYVSGVNFTSVATLGNGAIFKLTIVANNCAGTTPGGIGTLSTIWNTVYSVPATTTTLATNTINFVVTDGVVVYAYVTSNTNVVLFTSFESAMAATYDGAITYQTTLAAASKISGWAQLVHISDFRAPSIQ